MEVSICNCNCNRHFSFVSSKPLLKPSLQFRNCNFPNFQLKPSRRRVSVCAGGRGGVADTQTLPQSAIQRIAEKLRSLGYVEESSSDSSDEPSIGGANSPGAIFVPLPSRLPKHRVGHTLDPSWSTPENPVPEPGAGDAIQRFHELRRGVLEKERERIRKRKEEKRETAPSLAELTLPAPELRRLRSIGIALRKKLKVGKAGITEGIVNGIHERWRRSEVVRITCEDICRLNMKRTHELLEKKTGGLVVWRSGSNIILFRGTDYKYPYFATDRLSNDSSEESHEIDQDQRILSTKGTQSPVANTVDSSRLNSDAQIPHPPLIQGVGSPNRVRFQLSGEAQIAEEADALLEGLGPRFKDWWGSDPLPVDADLLPAVIPGYRRPFRLLPYGVKPKLTNDEMTTLRRLGRHLPIHFALGRNRKLQGLAAAILKLWEKCEIAKIAIKRGVQNTSSELMAEEIKWWTGGSLLSRDREFIVLYRGKDFLPAAVSSAIEERRKHEFDLSKSRVGNLSIGNERGYESTVNEHAVEAEQDEENDQKFEERIKMRKARSAEAAMERASTKLSMALEKKSRAEKLLAELEEEQTLQPPPLDKEGITEEERYMLRKVGLRMKPFLLLGRRGVFDGTVENMHLHWKYRELVKVCIGKRSIEEVHEVARILEAESGGILVAVEPVSKGYAIIVYRGKNYKRPASLRPRSLLSKREAMKRSLEAQRRQSLKLHVLKLNRHIDALKLKMEKDVDINDTQLMKDLKPGAVDQENDESLYEEDEFSDTDSDSDNQSFFEDPANEARETGGTDATFTELEDSVDTANVTLDFSPPNLLGDDSVGPAAKNNYLFEKVEPELHHKSSPKGTIGFAVGRPQDRTRTSTTNYIPSHGQGGRYNTSGNWNAQPRTTVQKSIPQRSPSVPSRVLQLSNKERLLLRKQALKIKRAPLLAVGKSNVITGVAKTIKEHFEKHPLAIVSIKGRAKGTSAREVIYNLQQATGAILVSHEPSKVILYRGWGSGIEPEPDQAQGEVKARPLVSPELMSAIRLECGLTSSIGELAVSDDIPSNN
ncbi:CRM-domain containing factor CFM2, chloroplastic [Salvia hispanica]|uniref:CRM-domain containing factor CFM2, chloroplastic n=1 Tax=Salvia hispanica TaxID=49212 RepID=UPI0020096EF3|nr:CRM-domain containing factor CFM2, chloroplastic [Salvia hispanica]XP_047960642.1 CRM-domain containing factor CFM2, chloroplastic [Salvia hispanica]XP_047960643.1 CRM-domain containing factor CFM2, chloroplastic [Salvia hispanica]